MKHKIQFDYQMSQAYQRFAMRRKENQRRGAPKYNIHKISFDDSQESQRSDVPNIYQAQRSQVQIPDIPMWQKKPSREQIIVRQESIQELKPKKQPIISEPSPKKRIEVIQLPSPRRSSRDQQQQQQQQQQIAQAQIQIEPHTSLSIMEIIKLYLGEYLFNNIYPIKKAIYINNNNEQQNEINKKQFEIKFKNQQKEISHFDNSIYINYALFITVLIFRNIFTYFYIYIWIAIIILQAIAQAYLFNGPIQYGSNKSAQIVLIIIAIIFQCLGDILSVKKRRSWEENKNSYKVYHHNGKMAEWANLKAFQIKPGHMFTVAPGAFVPTDCVLIHSQHSIIQIKQTHIVSYLVESPSEIVLKETLVKGQNINLPYSGNLTYEITNAEYSSFQIIGKLNLQQPNQASHVVSMNQIILRGSINYSDVQILCLAMQTGIDSLFLKNLQYPFQHRKIYQQSNQIKSRIINDEISLQIKQKQITLLGVPLQKKIKGTVNFFIFIYLLISGIGILSNFIYRITTPNQFYLGKTTISMLNIVIYHLTNFIIFIPVLLIPISKLFILFSGSIAQANISKRPVDLISDAEKYKRATSNSAFLKNANEELLDNKKIIFPAKIKDHNILPQLCNIDTIITTIDTFRDQSAFVLHSIRVKELNHNFATANLDIYSTQDLEDIRKFMNFAVLTTIKGNIDSSLHYDDGIELTAKKYLEIKRAKNAYGQYMINGSEQSKVKHIFTIQPTSQYPYKVVFLQPVLEQQQQNPNILVLIRGDTKIILDKTYGKQVSLTIQSRKLHQEKDYYVQLLAKTSIRLSDAQEIQRAYNSNTIQKYFFYKNLDKYISKVQPMGLLLFVNNFFQKKVGQTIKNPILNKSILQEWKYQKNETYDTDIYASQHMPNLIILSPASRSAQPQFQSLHTIKNLLMNSYLFNFSLTEVSEKILQDKPSNIQKMMEKMQVQRVSVWDSWDQKDIIYTIDILKKYGKKILFYVQKDEYMYLMKQCDCSVKGSKLGYDAQKYSDIIISSRSSLSYFYLTQLIRYDSLVIKQGLLSIFFTQIAKLIFYFIIEFINIFYTRGSGLGAIRTPLYLVVEVTLILDIFYYLNWKDSMRGETFNKRQNFNIEVFIRVVYAMLQGVFITFICLYSLESPPDSTGTPHSYHFVYFTIVYSFLHVLVFEKIFNILTYSISIYKLIILGVQILVLYIGFMIVSVSDTYEYYGILWSAMVGKIFMTALICIWICVSLPAIRMLLHLIKSKKVKKAEKFKKTF